MSRVMIFFFLSLVLVPPGLASGHPPDGVELVFNTTENVLQVTVRHNVKDLGTHYVDQIVVELNGEKIIEQSFKSQSDSRLQMVEYRIIDAEPGDEILVTARCNISGRKKVKITVEEQTEQQEAVPTEEE